MPETEIDTANRFLVGMAGGGLVVMGWARLGPPISKAEALNLAAYLVSMAEAIEPYDLKFEDVLKAVQST